MKDYTQMNLFEVMSPLDMTSEIIRAEDLSPIEYESFVLIRKGVSGGSTWDYMTGEYDRDTNVYQIYAMYAKLTDTILYIKDFWKYPYIQTCGSAKEANRIYEDCINKTRELCTHSISETRDGSIYRKLDVQIPFEDMYKLHNEDDSWDYSVKEYADRVNYGYKDVLSQIAV